MQHAIVLGTSNQELGHVLLMSTLRYACKTQQQKLNLILFTYLFICNLFNAAVSSSGNITFNDRMINEKLMGKDVEGSGHGLT
jgi:hypothetical protein